MVLVVEALDGDFLDGAVHPLDLAVGPWVVRLGEPMLDVVGLADHVEAHLARRGGVAVTRLLGELDAVIDQNRVYSIRYGFEQVFEELPSCSPVSLVDQLRHRKLAGPLNPHEHVQLAFGGLHFGDVDVKEADRVAFEELTLRLVPLDVRQAGDAVSLQTTVQG